jgi:hypothetical protein
MVFSQVRGEEVMIGTCSSDNDGLGIALFRRLAGVLVCNGGPRIEGPGVVMVEVRDIRGIRLNGVGRR